MLQASLDAVFGKLGFLALYGLIQFFYALTEIMRQSVDSAAVKCAAFIYGYLCSERACGKP